MKLKIRYIYLNHALDFLRNYDESIFIQRHVKITLLLFFKFKLPS